MVSDTQIVNIPNTFAPNSKNKMFSVDMIIHGLRFGFIQIDSLPEDVKTRVQDKLNLLKQTKPISA